MTFSSNLKIWRGFRTERFWSLLTWSVFIPTFLIIEGLEALRRTLNKRSNPVIPTDHIVDLAELALRNNNFEFDGSHFLQKRGTAIGTRMAPAYANLFMHHLESQLLN